MMCVCVCVTTADFGQGPSWRCYGNYEDQLFSWGPSTGPNEAQVNNGLVSKLRYKVQVVPSKWKEVNSKSQDEYTHGPWEGVRSCVCDIKADFSFLKLSLRPIRQG